MLYSWREVFSSKSHRDLWTCLENGCRASTEHEARLGRKAAAVPDTLGSGGLLTEDADPRIAAAAIHRLVTDGELRDAMKKEQEKTLARFSPERTRAILLDCLKPYREA